MYRFKIYIFILLLIFPAFTLLSTDLEISWIENTEPDLAGYRVYYGNQSGIYEHQINVGLSNKVVMTELQDQIEYYFVMTAFDSAGNESNFSNESVCILNDPVPLKVDSVLAPNPFNVLVYFNKVCFGHDVSNYTISNDIVIENVELLADHKTVRLITSNQKSNTPYVLTVKDLTDIALPPNHLDEQTVVYQVNFLDDDGDDENDTFVELLIPQSETTLLLQYNKPVTAEELNPDNYLIDPNIQIISAEKISANKVRINTRAHQPGQLYTVQVSLPADSLTPNQRSVRDYFYMVSNESHLPPVVELVHTSGAGQVQVMFDKPVDPSVLSELSINNGIQVRSANIDSSGRLVVLNTSPHDADKYYTLSFKPNSITERQDIPGEFDIVYQFKIPDNLPPALQSITFQDAFHINLHFTEPVDFENALLPGNYIIDHNMQVFNVIPDPSGNMLTLQTSVHGAYQQYNLQIKNIRDRSFSHNAINSDKVYSYTFTPNDDLLRIIDVATSDSNTMDVFFNLPLDVTLAEDEGHYQLAQEMRVISANVHSNNTAVRLFTTSLQNNRLYTISTSGILKENANSYQAGLNTQYTFEYRTDDTIGPIIKTVYSSSADKIVVLFNEFPDPVSAEQEENYNILEGIQVLDARLSASGNMVVLLTEPHPLNETYTLQINNISENGNQGNICPDGCRFSYKVTVPDHTEPYITQINVLNTQQIQLVFNEPVTGAGVLRRESYKIDKGNVQDVFRNSSNSILLVTSPHYPNRMTKLSINSIEDMAGNFISNWQDYYCSYNGQDTKHVSITKVTPVSENQVMISFSHQIDIESAMNTTSYQADQGAGVVAAQLVNPDQVLLTFTGTVTNQGYWLYIDEIPDSKHQRTSVPVYYYFYLDSQIETNLSIESSSLQGSNTLQIRFNRELDWKTVELTDNYQISPATQVYQAVLQDDDKTVTLYTSAHYEAIPYRMQIDGLQPMDGAVVDKGHYFDCYKYLPVLDVLSKNMSSLSFDLAEIGETYYKDRDYVITSMPGQLANARLFKTQNDDKNSNKDDYLSLQLTEPAVIYVAYDARAESVPDWLSEDFRKTGLKVGVSDQAGKMPLWQGYFGSGELVLGGNAAKGADGAKSMYLVFVTSPTAEVMDEYQQAGDESSDSVPETFSLSQNFPNPFNPVTNIKYDLDADRYVRLKIYNIMGQEVITLVDAFRPAGYYLVPWNGTDTAGYPVAAGIYFYRFEMWDAESGNQVKTLVKKMMLLK